MPNNAAYDTRTTVPANRLAQAVGLNVAARAAATSFVPLVADALGSETVDANASGFRRGVYSDFTDPFGGRNTVKHAMLPMAPPPSCGGSHNFGWRRTLPQDVTEGYTIWQRFYLYLPSTFSFGYTYYVRDTVDMAASAAAGDTDVFIQKSVHFSFSDGMAIRIKLDDLTYHFTHVATGGVLGPNNVRLEDALPGPAASGNFVAIYDEAEARECGKEADQGDSGIKWVHFGPNSGSLVAYTKVSNSRRVIEQQAGAVLALEPEVQQGAKSTPFDVPLDQWVCWQMAAKVAKDGTGFLRVWINEELKLESLSIDTLSSTSSATGFNRWGLGDYWNGGQWSDGAPGRSDFYSSEAIVATDMPGYGAPTGVDAAGNAYIDPETRVGDLV